MSNKVFCCAEPNTHAPSMKSEGPQAPTGRTSPQTATAPFMQPANADSGLWAGVSDSLIIDASGPSTKLPSDAIIFGESCRELIVTCATQ